MNDKNIQGSFSASKEEVKGKPKRKGCKRKATEKLSKITDDSNLGSSCTKLYLVIQKRVE